MFSMKIFPYHIEIRNIIEKYFALSQRPEKREKRFLFFIQKKPKI